MGAQLHVFGDEFEIPFVVFVQKDLVCGQRLFFFPKCVMRL